MGDVSVWISKYNKAIDAVDWDAAAREWTRLKSTFIANYTNTTGLNPNMAAKYRKKVEAAEYRRPDPAKMKTNYAAKVQAR